jgi:cyclopropane fatty-acyl-phospholipid synthase-like methyltransferase
MAYELTKQYYDRNAAIIFRTLKRHYNAHLISRSDRLDVCVRDDISYILQHASLRDGQTVLECGCGNGFFSRMLMSALPQVKYFGVDISESQVGLARQLNPTADIRELNYENVEFAADALDRILFLETLGYCIGFDVLLSKLFEILKPGGRVFVKNPGQKIADRDQFIAQCNAFEPVSREYGFEPESLGMIPDIDHIIDRFRQHGFVLELEDYPYMNEYFYNASFYAEPGICWPARCEDKTTAIYDFRSFNPERSLSDLGKSHPRYIEFHRSISDGTVYQTRNRLYGCVVLVFVKTES